MLTYESNDKKKVKKKVEFNIEKLGYTNLSHSFLCVGDLIFFITPPKKKKNLETKF